MFLDSRRHLGKRGFEDRGGGEEEAAVGLEHDDLVGRELRRRIGLDDVTVLGEDPLLQGDVVRLADDVRASESATPATTAYCNGMAIVSANVVTKHDPLCETGPPDRTQVCSA